MLQRHVDVVMLLDLDKTTIWGNDGNDFGLALQWMEKPKEKLDMLYRTLVSPQVRPAFEQLKWSTEKIDVVLYTRRPALLTYRSCFRRCMIPLRYHKVQRKDGQLYIPGSIETVEQLRQLYCGPKLLPEEEHDVSQSLQRLFSARAALTAALGLSTPMTVVVTAGVKDVVNTVTQLGLRPDRAFLFDDNKSLPQDGHLVRVEPFVSLPAPRRQELLDLMQREVPVEEMEPDLVQFLLGAAPTERALEWDASHKLWRWRVPLAERGVPTWTMPTIPVDSDSDRGLPVERLQQAVKGGRMQAGKRRARMQLQRQLSCHEPYELAHAHREGGRAELQR